MVVMSYYLQGKSGPVGLPGLKGDIGLPVCIQPEWL